MDVPDSKTRATEGAVGTLTKRDYEAIYLDQKPWLIGFFRRHIRDNDDARNLAQESILRFIRAAPKLELQTPRAYLRRIAINLLSDRRKSDRRHAAELHVALEDYHVAGPSLESQLEARDMLRRVEEALCRLNPRTREIFMAVRVDGMSYAEVHERTGLSLKIIEKEMTRALAQINRMTAED